MATKKRLIDADLLVRDIEADPYRTESEKSYDRCLVHRQPTVDAVEVVHGRWIAVPSSDMMTGKAFKCSECNKMRYGSFMPNYCQNCGARMDK